MSNQKIAWENSYRNKDNFLFYPHEEVIRFFAKFVIKRKGLFEFEKKHQLLYDPKILDLGCGIGRHVIFGYQSGIDSYGIDLSSEAVKKAIEWATWVGMKEADKRIVQGDSTSLPYQNDLFDFIVCHGVLDSMPLDLVKKSVTEANRVIKVGGVFYCDLISGDDSNHSREFSGEQIIKTDHERDTTQLFYNFSLINEIFSAQFNLVEVNLIKKENIIDGVFASRYHLTLQKK